LAAAATEIEAALRELVADCPAQVPMALRQMLTATQKTVERPQVHIAIAGLFKAGKSTLINSIIGRDLLPHQEMPETGAPIWIRKGPKDAASYTDQAGQEHGIAPSREALSAATSLYDAEGNRRPQTELAREVDVQLARWPLPDDVVLIDLPGLRDTAELDRLSLAIARQADLVVWLFRSEPAFSEQDAAALDHLVATCGNHVVQLVVNAFRPEQSLRSWRRFLKRRLPVQRTRLGEFIGEIGLESRHVETMIVVDARRARAGWFWTFGGRQLFSVLREAAGRDSLLVKRARYPRVVHLLIEIRSWLSPALTEAVDRFQAAQRLLDAHLDETDRRRADQEACRQAFSDLYDGLARDISDVVGKSLRHVDHLASTSGGDAAPFFVDALNGVLNGRGARLALRLTKAGTSDALLRLATDDILFLLERWHGLESVGSIEALPRAVHEQISDALGPLGIDPPRITAKGIWGRLTGARQAIPVDTSDIREAIRQCGQRIASDYIARKEAASDTLSDMLHVPEKPAPPIPDASVSRSLTRFDERLARLETLLARNKAHPGALVS
jgi:predicted GTPase